MRLARLILPFVCITLMCSIYSPNVKGDEWDKKTIVTFSGPVSVSGHRLEAGTYVFKLADSPSNRHIVQIFNERENHVYATILAIPDWRVTPTSKTKIKFSERAGEMATLERELPDAGIPVKEWFYPGDNFGQEFLIKPAPIVAQTTTTETAVATTTPAPEERPVETAEAQPIPQPEPQAIPEAQPEPEQQPVATPPPAELPQTASPLPLIGLIGLASLGVGLSLRQVVKRMS